jgi:hypothetical protein
LIADAYRRRKEQDYCLSVGSGRGFFFVSDSKLLSTLSVSGSCLQLVQDRLLFVCGVFNDAVGSCDYKASNGRMTDEQ